MTKYVRLSDNKIYHEPTNTEPNLSISFKSSDKRPTLSRISPNTPYNSLYGPNIQYKSPLGKPIKWLKVKVIGSSKTYLTPIYEVNELNRLIPNLIDQEFLDNEGFYYLNDDAYKLHHNKIAEFTSTTSANFSIRLPTPSTINTTTLRLLLPIKKTSSQVVRKLFEVTTVTGNWDLVKLAKEVNLFSSSTKAHVVGTNNIRFQDLLKVGEEVVVFMQYNSKFIVNNTAKVE